MRKKTKENTPLEGSYRNPKAEELRKRFDEILKKDKQKKDVAFKKNKSS